MSADNEVATRRLLRFPRGKVFEAWTDPAKLARWWGPKGFYANEQNLDRLEAVLKEND